MTNLTMQEAFKLWKTNELSTHFNDYLKIPLAQQAKLDSWEHHENAIEPLASNIDQAVVILNNAVKSDAWHKGVHPLEHASQAQAPVKASCDDKVGLMRESMWGKKDKSALAVEKCQAVEPEVSKEIQSTTPKK